MDIDETRSNDVSLEYDLRISQIQRNLIDAGAIVSIESRRVFK